MAGLEQKAFEYWGALAFCGIGLVIALGWTLRQWMLALARIEALHALRHADAVEQGKVGEVMRDTMAANTTALLANTEIVKMALNRRARGGGGE